VEIEQVAELARTVAALPQAEKDFFDGLVADERAKAADAERIAKLRGMSDRDVIEHAVRGGTAIGPDPGDLVVLVPSILRVLSEAGFVRYPDGKPKADLPEAITRVREVVQEIDGMARRGRPIENSPSLKHWLLCALDALTGENHSGYATSLPQPKKVA
jgi:hypothetical protein